MKSLRTLAALTIGSIVLSATYAVAVKDQSVRWSSDSDEGRSVRHIVNGDRGEFSLTDDDRKIKAKWRGKFELSEDGGDIASIERDLEIEIEEDGVKERVEFEKYDNAIEKTYYLNSDEQEAGAETDEAVSALVLKFLRASGLKAEERVSAILENKNSAAVLEEMEYLQGDHAVRRYAVALVEKTDLTKEEIVSLSELLSKVESDHDLRLAISAVLEHEEITAEMTPVLLNAANGIESDHDMRKLLEAFAEGPLSEEAMEIALGLYERIESDHDLRQAADALLSNDALTLPQAARLLTAAADQIESDHDMRLILSESAPMFSKDEAFTRAWIKGFDAIESSHDQRLALSEAVDVGDHPVSAWEKLIDRAGMIDSSHDQRLALESIADHIEGEPELVAAYRTAASKIDSEHDRERALEAIGESEDD